MRQVGDGLIRPHRQGVVEFDGARQVVGVEGKCLALFGDGTGQRLEEGTRGQDHVLRHAAAFLTGRVLGNQRDTHALARQRMFR